MTSQHKSQKKQAEHEEAQKEEEEEEQEKELLLLTRKPTFTTWETQIRFPLPRQKFEGCTPTYF